MYSVQLSLGLDRFELKLYNPYRQPRASPAGKESAYRKPGFIFWVRKIPWRREWQSTPVFLPEESHGQRSLVGYSPWDYKEPDMTERLALLHKGNRRKSAVTVESGCVCFLFWLMKNVKALLVSNACHAY